MRDLRIRLQRWRRARALRRIRTHIEALGYSLDGISDEQIEKGLHAFGRDVRNSMPDVAQAARGMAALGAAARELSTSPKP